MYDVCLCALCIYLYVTNVIISIKGYVCGMTAVSITFYHATLRKFV